MTKDFIYKPNSVFDGEIDPHSSNVEEYFTLIGSEDFIDNNSLARLKIDSEEHTFAKKVVRKNGTTKYMVKLSNSGKLHNPVSIYGVDTDRSFLNRVCRSNNKFKEVNQRAFEWYLKFLNSKNLAWLNNAEREME
jgi:hypothetical protein